MSENIISKEERKLFAWKKARGALMFMKKAHELTDEEQKFMRTPPDGWSYSVEKSDYVYAK